MVDHVLRGLEAWWWKVSDEGRDILRQCDLSLGLIAARYLDEWSSLGGLMKGNAFGIFSDTMNDIHLSVERADNQVGEDGAGDR